MKLFENNMLGNIRLKNRIAMAPMGRFAAADGCMTDESVRYYLERAKGGVGMIITNSVKVTDAYDGKGGQEMTALMHINKVYSLVEQCHGYDTKVCIQLISGLGRIKYTDPYTPPRSAGNNPCLAYPSLICKPLDKDEIKDLVQKTGYAAKLSLMAGVDAIDYIIGGGYLNDEFMTPCWNDRTDEYGGSLENRMRFTLECIAEIKKNIGNQIPLIVKFTPCHFLPNGRTMEEGLEIAKMLEKAGVDAFHVDMGTWDNLNYVVPSVYDKVGLNIQVAEQVKQVVSVPVLSSGKLTSDIDQTEKWLEEGKTDYIIVGRQLLADPEWPNKVKEGRRADIRPCLRCSECWRSKTSGVETRCAINPVCNNEGRYELGEPVKTPKNILVIGGGPGGMYAAAAAADRGCKVDLVEKTDRLGGRVQAAAAPEFKKEMRPYIEYMRRQVAKRDINVMLNTEIKAEDIPAGKYDKIIIATGAVASCPPVPGIEKTHPAEDYLLGKETAGKEIVVIGGGFVGSETAAHLKTSDNNVTVIEMLENYLGASADAANSKFGLKKLVAEKNLNFVLGARVTEIGDGYVKYIKDNEEKCISADTVINAMGYKAHGYEFADSLKGKCADINVIGDAVKAPRKILNAVHEAHHIIRAMQ